MDWLKMAFDFVLHVEHHLQDILQYFGVWTYVVMFLVIFAETGLVITPFLPGDSLLFALGAFASKGHLDLTTLLVSLSIAAVLGDTVNYWIGAWLGPRIFRGETVRFLNRKHLEKAHEFFERYGGKTIILARFMPIVRTFAPFVAGMGRMTYTRFMSYNIIGGLIWIFSFTLLGYAFAKTPVVEKNFTYVILGIIVLSVLPAVVEIIRERRKLKRAAAAQATAPDPV